MAHDLDRTDELCLYSFDSHDVYLEQDYASEMKPIWDALDNIGVPSRQRSGLLLALLGEDPPTGLAIDKALLKLKQARNRNRLARKSTICREPRFLMSHVLLNPILEILIPKLFPEHGLSALSCSKHRPRPCNKYTATSIDNVARRSRPDSPRCARSPSSRRRVSRSAALSIRMQRTRSTTYGPSRWR